MASDFAALLQACELRNMLVVARLVTLAAFRREESRGAHCRTDFPDAREDWRRRQMLGLADLETADAQADSPRPRVNAS